MKVFYGFVDGTSSVVEVSDEIGMAMKELDRYEDRIRKREQRHCYSYDTDDYNKEKNYDFACYDKRCDDEDEPLSYIDRLHIAISKLKPSQRKLIKAIYFDGLTSKEYAAMVGVSPAAISQRLQVAEKNLKKFF